MIFPIVLATFVAVLTWFARDLHDFLLPGADVVSVPSFVGQTINDAASEIERQHLTYNVIEHTTSDRYPKNVVINQQPEAGAQVRKGRQISFVVSDGVVARLMPDLRYQSMREVALDLARTRVQLGTVTYQHSDVVPEGHVIDQDPAPLAAVNENDKVNLIVSEGGATALLVPDFRNMNIDIARAQAAREGLKIGQLVWTPLGSKGPAHGIIARQQPAPGTRVNSFEPVSLQVSAGPHESGYLLRQAHLLVSVPVPDDPTSKEMKVRIVVTDATGRYDLFNAYAQPGQKLDFTVTSLGTSVVDMYVDSGSGETLVGETRLGNEPPNAYAPGPPGSKAPVPNARATP